jgi:hypothetical protein
MTAEISLQKNLPYWLNLITESIYTWFLKYSSRKKENYFLIE